MDVNSTDMDSLVSSNAAQRFVEGNLEVMLSGSVLVEIPFVVPIVTTGGIYVLQAAVNGSGTAGAASVTLPNNYAEYSKVSLAMFESGASRIGTAVLLVPMLAAQTSSQVIVVSGNPGASNLSSLASVTWNPTARTLTANQRDRIIYAALER